MTKKVEVKRKDTAYHGDRERKKKFLAEMRAHRKADSFLQKSTGEFDKHGKFRGCGIACSVYSIRKLQKKALPNAFTPRYRDDIGVYRHYETERYLGISAQMADAFEGIFEGLPVNEARDWPVQFAGALKVGTKPLFGWNEYDEFIRVYDAVIGLAEETPHLSRKGVRAQRDWLLDKLRRAKPVVDVR